MVIKVVEPPKCPNCKKPLFEVWENEYSYLTFKWDSEKGVYKETSDFFDGELEVICPYCNSDITELFEDGVCNFSKGEKNG